MSTDATIMRKNVEHENFEPDEYIREYLQSLSPAELRMLASYARKMAAGKEDPHRRPGGEGGRWLSAQYVRGSGPYFYLHGYSPAELTRTDEYGLLKSGSSTTKYVGRRLSAELAEEFGYPEGTTPEETDLTLRGTPRRGDKRKKSE